jgi:hypothetical protein
MITGDPLWQAALDSEQKEPLFVFQIPAFALALCTFFPLTKAANASACLPTLDVPRGPSQSVDELTGHTNISQYELTAIDPTGRLKQLSADPSFIGSYCQLRLGFPGLDLANPDQFVALHSGRIRAIGRTADGKMTIAVEDGITRLNDEVFINGGPLPWAIGQGPMGMPLYPPAVLDNGELISDDNPRYLSGNPIDILLAVAQNEMGFGQSSPPLIVVTGGDGSGTGQAGYGINPDWQQYDAIDPATLINPNPGIDVPVLLQMRDNEFPQERWEFVRTSSSPGKAWLEDQILKVCGLYWITRGDGQLKPHSMKYPAGVSPSVSIDQNQTVSIPTIDRWPIINIVKATVPQLADGSGDEVTLTFAQQKSLDLYRAPYVHTLNAEGLRFSYGATSRLFLLINRIFNRHAFHTPIYTVPTFFKNLVVELGDFIALSHPLVLDLKTGAMGLTDVICEVIHRQPDYPRGQMTLTVADTRFMSPGRGRFVVADDASGIPDWGGASPSERATYMFISEDSGGMSDGAPGNTIG